MCRQYAQPLICDTRVFTKRDQLVVETAVLQIFLHAGQGGDTVGGNGEWVECLCIR